MAVSDGNGDRATIALVNSKIDTVLATVEGHRSTTDAQLQAIRTEIRSLSGLSGRLDTLEQKNAALEAQVSELQRDRTFRLNVRPGILLGIVGVLLAAVNVYVVVAVA